MTCWNASNQLVRCTEIDHRSALTHSCKPEVRFVGDYGRNADLEGGIRPTRFR